MPAKHDLCRSLERLEQRALLSVAPLTSAQISTSTPNTNGIEVDFQIFDPVRNKTVKSSVAYPGSSTAQFYINAGDLKAADGIVAWKFGQFTFGSSTADSAGIGFSVYDANAGKWVTHEDRKDWSTTSHSYWEFTGPVLSAGNVAWMRSLESTTAPGNESDTVSFASYDPSLASWKIAEKPFEWTTGSGTYGTTSTPVALNGMFAFQFELHSGISTVITHNLWTAYDPGARNWIFGDQEEVRSNGGKILSEPSWTANQSVSYTVTAYDSHGTTVSTQQIQLGYSAASRSWLDGPTRAFALQYATPNHGPRGTTVWVWDQSLGGTTWQTSYGDGTTNGGRSGWHTYVRAGIFSIAQTVTGPGGTSARSNTITIDGDVTTIGVAANTSTTTQGQQVVLTATISAQNTTPRTGTVQFFADGIALESPVSVTNNQAILAISTLLVGLHSIYAAYSGDGTFAASTSPSLKLTVKPALTADIDNDGIVGFSDLVVLSQHYGQVAASYFDGDLNGDGVVNFGDLVILAQNYGTHSAARQVANAGKR